MRSIVMLLVLFWSLVGRSAEPVKPISVSYENLIRCFPELKNEKLSFKVDLNFVKELSDEKFLTSQSQLRQRKIRFRESNGGLAVLILRANLSGSKTVDTVLTLQKIDDKGIVSEQRLSDTQRINPKPEFINSFLVGAVVISDEYSYNDTKLNGVSSSYRRNFKDIEEFNLSDTWKKRSIACEKKSELGIICTCLKK